MNKTCIKCGYPRPINEFYAHPATADGRLGKGKQCCKDDANARRAMKIDEIRAYDRSRNNLPHRVEARKTYREKNPEVSIRANKKWRLKNSDRYKAETLIGNELRAGRIEKSVCEICGETRVEAHHDDYAKPLEVRWLCRQHHVVADKIRRINEAA